MTEFFIFMVVTLLLAYAPIWWHQRQTETARKAAAARHRIHQRLLIESRLAQRAREEGE